MLIEFTLNERLAGFLHTSAKKGEKVDIIFRELIGPDHPDLANRLEQMHNCLFSKIPNLPGPARIDNLIIAIDGDLKGRAYVDDLPRRARVVLANAVEKGQLLFLRDISRIESVELPSKIADTEAVVIVQSFGWKRSLFFDFGPLHQDAGPRTYNLEKTMGQQMSLLMGLPVAEADVRAGQSRLQVMKESLDRLDVLLSERCEQEAQYQELLASAPWMLGMSYRAIIRHQKMDDANIPDFTAVRAYDECHDVVEMKQPFLKLFRSDGSFNAAFSDAWNQAERYLDFCQRQRPYLRDQKQLQFENPRAVLLIGHDLTAGQSDAIRAKESLNRLITAMSYDQLRKNAQHVFDLLSAVGDRNYIAS